MRAERRAFSLTGVIVWSLWLAQPLEAQKPVIARAGVVNSASLGRGGWPRGCLSATSLATIFGENLASQTEAAATVPLPTKLAGTSVTFAGVPAPLLFVSPGQINLQVPTLNPFQPHLVPVIVHRELDGDSEPALIQAYSQPNQFNYAAFFTRNGSGCGEGVLFNVENDGAWTPNSPLNSAEPGQMVVAYGTGIGFSSLGIPQEIRPRLPSQRAWSFLSLPASGYLRPSIVAARETDTDCAYCGPAPGLIGVDQYNIRIRDDAPEGCAVPMFLEFQAGGMLTQPIPVSIRRGGGRCVDPPAVSLAEARLEQTWWVSDAVTQVRDEFEIRLARGPYVTFDREPRRRHAHHRAAGQQVALRGEPAAQ